MYDERGSVWRKWDLHVHTPASIIQHYGGDQDEVWEKYIADLEDLPEEYSVLGINDYLFIDGYERLVKEKNENDRLKNIDLLLPVIEFRIDKFAGVDFGKFSRINLHVIFSDEVTPKVIRRQFLNTLDQSYVLSNDDVEWKRTIDRESLIHLGKQIRATIPEDQRDGGPSNLELGFNNLNLKEDQIFESLDKDCFEEKYLTAVGKTEWAELKWSDSSISTKKDIINKVDLVFTASGTVGQYKKSKQTLREQGVNDLLIDCSDAHHFSGSQEKEKLGNSFTWIKADPEFLGLRQIINEPQNRVYIGEEPSKIKLIRSNQTKYIREVSFKKENESSESEMWFEKTNSIKLNHDLVAIIGNKGMGKSALADIIALTSNSKRDVKDFSFLNRQKFRHKRNNKAKHFRAITVWQDGTTKEMNLDETVDFQEVELAHYLPQKYIEKICNEIGVKEESEFDKQLEKVIFSHVSDSDKLGCNSLEELLEYKTNEVNERIKSISNELDSLNKKIIKLNHKLSNSYKESLQKDLKEKKKELESLEQNPPEKVPEPQSSEQIQEKIEKLNLKIEEVREKVEDLEQKKKSKEKDLKEVTKHVSSADKIIEKLKNFEKDYNKLSTNLSVPTENVGIDLDDIITFNIDYEVVVEKRDEWKSKKIQINKALSIDDKSSIVRDVKANQLYLNWLQSKLNEPNRKYQEYINEKKEWEKQKEEVIGDEDTQDTIEYFKRQLKYIDEVPQILENRKEKREELCEEIHQELKEFLKEIVESIETNIQKEEKASVNDQLRKGVDEIDIYNYIFSLPYLSPKYELKMGEKEISQLSPGERGTLLLIFYLLVDQDDRPIIIDQPEENLDNETVFDTLVPCIKKAKENRQIIVVTHNPNLAVVCDAEQIISANIDKENSNKVSYETGSIENPKINKEILDVLEGTRPAFDNRDAKYIA